MTPHRRKAQQARHALANAISGPVKPRPVTGSCDCCGKTRALTFVVYAPVGDTWVCNECRGVDTEESEVDFDEMFLS